MSRDQMELGDEIALIIGYTGAVLLIISFLAQLYSIYKIKTVDNLSYVFILLQLLVNIMFFIYDISIGSIPLIISNGSVAILLTVMVGQKYYYTHYNEIKSIMPATIDSNLSTTSEISHIV